MKLFGYFYGTMIATSYQSMVWEEKYCPFMLTFNYSQNHKVSAVH